MSASCDDPNNNDDFLNRHGAPDRTSSGQAELQVFAFDSHDVRVVMIDGEPWWVAGDVAKALGYGRTQEAIRRLDDDERRGCRIDTPFGGPQETVIVSEPGLYSLVLRAKTPDAKRFKRWVTHEVLPAIRKAGSFSMRHAQDSFEIPSTYAEALRLAAEQAEALERLEVRVAEVEPKAEQWDVLAGAEGDYSLKEAAEKLCRDHGIKTGQKRLMEAIRRWEMVDRNDRPYSKHLPHLVSRAVSFSVRRRGEDGVVRYTGETRVGQQIRITVRGLAYIRKRYHAEIAALATEGGAQ